MRGTGVRLTGRGGCDLTATGIMDDEDDDEDGAGAGAGELFSAVCNGLIRPLRHQRRKFGRDRRPDKT